MTRRFATVLITIHIEECKFLALFGGQFLYTDLGTDDYDCLWAEAAARGVERKLVPLTHRKDFYLVPLFGPRTLSDGTVTQAFHPVFKTDPMPVLRTIKPFLVEWGSITKGLFGTDLDREIGMALPRGAETLPPSWRCLGTLPGAETRR
jgi:hypothetical protein